MPSPASLLAHLFAGIPAAIGVWFVARFAYVTSDTAIDGAGNAFLFAMIAAGAYAAPAVALIVAAKGRKVAAGMLWCLAVVALVTNWSQTLGAVASRGAGTEAVRAKAADAIKDDRSRLARIQREREAMKFLATDADAVKAAQTAVAAAERTRLAECGNGEPKQRGPNCRTRETEETTKRDILTAALANKALTDQAAKLDNDAAAIRSRLEGAKPVKEGNSLGEALGRLLPLSATTATTAQQGLLSAIAELLIAAALTLPELLRSEPPAAASRDEGQAFPPEPSSAPAKRPTTIAGVPLTDPPMPHAPTDADTVGRFMLPCLSRASGRETAGGAVYARYQRWCGDQQPQHAPLDAKSFAVQLAERCQRVDIRVRRDGGKVYFVGVRLIA